MMKLVFYASSFGVNAATVKFAYLPPGGQFCRR